MTQHTLNINSEDLPRDAVPLVQQMRRLGLLLVIIYVPLLVLALVLGSQQTIPVAVLLDDVTAAANVPFYTGILSNLGIVLWVGTSAVCLFTGFVWQTVHVDHRVSFYLKSAGLLTLFLALDDLLLLHDELLEDYLGIPEPLSFAVYIGLIMLFIIHFRTLIHQSDYLLLLIAFAFFGVSIFVDNVQQLLPTVYGTVRETAGLAGSADSGTLQQASGAMSNFRYLLEDGSKLLGIVAWALYFVRYCGQHLAQVLSSKSHAQ